MPVEKTAGVLRCIADYAALIRLRGRGRRNLASSLATGATVVAAEEEEEEARAFRPGSATAVRVRLCAGAVRPVIKSLAQTARGKRWRAALSIDFALPASRSPPPTPLLAHHPTRPASPLTSVWAGLEKGCAVHSGRPTKPGWLFG